MKRLLLSIFALLLGINSYTMDAPMADVGKKRPLSQEETEEIAPQPKEGRTEEESSNYLLSEYPEEIQDLIRSFLNTAPGFGLEKLSNVAKNIRALRLVSKTDRDKIDDPEFMQALIQFLAHRYTNSNKTKVVLALHTKSAADWLNKALLNEKQKHSDFSRLDTEVTNELIDQFNQGHIDAARFLLNAAKVPDQNQYLVRFAYANAANRTALLQAAAKAGDLQLFTIILAHTNSILPIINHVNDDGDTALFTAITHDHTPIALALLHRGASPFISNQNIIIDNALLRASFHNNTEVVRELLLKPQVQQAVNFTNDLYSLTPLENAAGYNNYPMFELLVNTPNVLLDGHVLYKALANNTQMVRDLITHNIDVNQNALEGLKETPAAFGIFRISENGNPLVDDTVARDRLALLLPQLNVNLANEDRQTLLMLGVQQAKTKTIEKLLEANADVSLKDKAGHDALWYAQQLEVGNKDLIIKRLQDAAARQEKARKKQEEIAIKNEEDELFSVLNLEEQK